MKEATVQSETTLRSSSSHRRDQNGKTFSIDLRGARSGVLSYPPTAQGMRASEKNPLLGVVRSEALVPGDV